MFLKSRLAFLNQLKFRQLRYHYLTMATYFKSRYLTKDVICFAHFTSLSAYSADEAKGEIVRFSKASKKWVKR